MDYLAENRVREKSSDQSNRYTSGKDIEKALLSSAAKDVLEKGDDQYLNFDPDTAVQSFDIMGKHIQEFRRR